MYRTDLPVNIIVSKKTQEDIKELLKEKSSGKSQEDIYKENKKRLRVLEEIVMTAEEKQENKILSEHSYLLAAGYRVVSRKFKNISRIDRPDWKEYMAGQHSPWNIKQGMDWVEGLDRLNEAEDYYRRCLSKDKITLPDCIDIRDIPNSSYCSPTGYINKEDI